MRIAKHTIPNHTIIFLPLLIGTVGIFLCVFLFTEGHGNGIPESIAALLFYTVLCLFIIFRQDWLQREKYFLFIAFTFGFIVRFISALILFPLYLKYNTSLDQATYLQTSEQLAQIWQWPENPFIILNTKLATFGHLGMNIFLAAHFKISTQPVLFLVTNTFLSAFCVLPLYRITRRIIGDSTAPIIPAISAIIYTIFPLSIYWSTWALKESICCFLCIMFIDKLIEFFEKQMLIPSIMMLLILFILATLRMYLVPVLIMSALIAMIFYPKKSKRVVYFSLILVATTAFILIVSWPILSKSPATESLLNYTSLLMSENTFSIASKARTNFAVEGESAADKTGYSSPADMIKSLPLGILRTFTTPVQWFRKVQNFNEKIEIYFTAFWYFIFPFSVYGAYYMFRQYPRKCIGIFAYIAIIVMYFSIILMGGSFRQNNLLYPFLCMFAACGLIRWKTLLPFVFIFYMFLGVLVVQTELTIITTAKLVFPAAIIIIIILPLALIITKRKHDGSRSKT